MKEPVLAARGHNFFRTLFRTIRLLVDVRLRRQQERTWLDGLAERPPRFGSPQLIAMAALIARDAGRGVVLPDDLFWAALADLAPVRMDELVRTSGEPAVLRARVEQVAAALSHVDASEFSVTYSDEADRMLHETRLARPREGRWAVEVLRRLVDDPHACAAALSQAALTPAAVLDWAERASTFEA